MSILSKLFGGATAQPIEAVFKGIDALVTSDEEREAAELLKLKALQEPAKMQIELNKLEAQHRSGFVAGSGKSGRLESDALVLRGVPPLTVTKLGQNPSAQVKSLLQTD